MSNKYIDVQGVDIKIIKQENQDYVSLTDIARKKNQDYPKDVVKNWLRNQTTIEFLGLWESINNLNFNGVEFDTFKDKSGSNYFTLSPSQWIKKTNAIGIISKAGRYNSGTFAHKDIALEFASWVSVEFKLYLIKEFQKLKEIESKQSSIEWNVQRVISKINYKIHTDSIEENLIPQIIVENSNFIYSDEADLLNLALFNITAKDWRKNDSDKKGNIRDYAIIEQLIILSNLESLNAEFIRLNLSKKDRLIKLNNTAINQMKSLLGNINVKKLKNINKKRLE